VSFDVTFGPVEACVLAYRDACEETAALARVSPSFGDWLLACAGALTATDCACSSAAACPLPPPGDAPEGAPCAEGAECAGGGCVKLDPASCGTCATLASEGESCASAPCVPTAFCELGTYVCRAPLSEGEPCVEGDACQAPLVCQAGACTAPLAEGADCTGGTPSKSACDFAHEGLVCVNDQCRETGVSQLGEECGVLLQKPSLWLCRGDTWCDAVVDDQWPPGGYGTCAPRGDVGAPCKALPSPLVRSTCLPHLACVEGACVDAEPLGCAP
jgi:hypothetical protein